MPPVGQNLTAGNGPARDLSAATPPLASAGKNFISEMPCSIRRRISLAVTAPGRNATARFGGRRDESVGATGRDDELRARAACVAQLLWRVHRAGADHRPRDSARDPLDRLQRRLGPQRDLEHRQTAGDQRLGERHGRLRVRYGDHRHDTGGAQKILEACRHRLDRDSVTPARRRQSPGCAAPAWRVVKIVAPVSALLTASRNRPKSSRPVPSSLPGGASATGARIELGTEDVEGVGTRVDSDHVAVLEARERATIGRLRRAVDGGGHLAGGAGHAPVGDERDPVTAALEHAERRRETVQLRHPVGPRALEAHDHDDVAVELVPRKRLEEALLVIEHAGGRLDDA